MPTTSQLTIPSLIDNERMGHLPTMRISPCRSLPWRVPACERFSPMGTVIVNAVFIVCAMPLSFLLPRVDTRRLLLVMFASGIAVALGLSFAGQNWPLVFALPGTAGFDIGIGGSFLAWGGPHGFYLALAVPLIGAGIAVLSLKLKHSIAGAASTASH